MLDTRKKLSKITLLLLKIFRRLTDFFIVIFKFYPRNLDEEITLRSLFFPDCRNNFLLMVAKFVFPDTALNKKMDFKSAKIQI